MQLLSVYKGSLWVMKKITTHQSQLWIGLQDLEEIRKSKSGLRMVLWIIHVFTI